MPGQLRPIALKEPGRLSVGLLPLPNFTLIAFAGFIDMLRLAADEGDRSRQRACRWSVLAPTNHAVRASCGTEVFPTATFGQAPEFDVLVVIGGLLPHLGVPMLDPRTRAFIGQAAQRAGSVMGLCTGSFALAEAGLLPRGGRCCVSWYHYQDFLERFPDLRPMADRLWVTEGRVVTCAGGLAAVDLAACLVQAQGNGPAAQKGLRIMLVDKLRSAGSAQPQPANTVAVRDERVRRAMLLMEQSLSAPLSADVLAASVGLCKRQLGRLFLKELGVTLQAFARDLRLSCAVRLMAQANAKLVDVAMQCGFADAAHFNRVFRKAFGRSPSDAQRDGAAALDAMLAGWWPYDDVPTSGTAAAPERPTAQPSRSAVQMSR